MVVLDAVHSIQAKQANDMAVRWNCKAGKCGSCSAEINGKPRLMCMTRLNTLDLTQPVTVEPMKTFPHVRDLVTDVSWNYRVKMKIQPFKPRKPDAPDGSWREQQADVDRPQEFRKCIECFLCQDVCHVLRDHDLHEEFIGPRFLIYTAQLEMNPLDTGDRRKASARTSWASATATSPSAAPRCARKKSRSPTTRLFRLKERVVDVFFDPIAKLFGAGRVALLIRVDQFVPGQRVARVRALFQRASRRDAARSPLQRRARNRSHIVEVGDTPAWHAFRASQRDLHRYIANRGSDFHHREFIQVIVGAIPG